MGSQIYDTAAAGANAAYEGAKNVGNYINDATGGALGKVFSDNTFAGGPSMAGYAVDIVNDYIWTLSNVGAFNGEIPTIRIKEYKCNESSIKKQYNLYTNIAKDTAKNLAGLGREDKSGLSIYADIFPKTHPTGFIYTFPYFSQTAFELNTQEWQALDSLGDSLGQIADNLGGVGKAVKAAGELAVAASNFALNLKYPSVGVVDRPRMFNSHASRQIVISFPLYNTINEGDWFRNRNFIYGLMNQNLFYKRDYITGVPPVFYDISIPGQYYCYAACITNIKIDNLGNIRQLEGNIVPDAYQVSITLSEMVMPSQNQFDAITNGEASSYVTTSTLD